MESVNMKPHDAQRLLRDTQGEIIAKLRTDGLSKELLNQLIKEAGEKSEDFHAREIPELNRYQKRGVLALAAIQKVRANLPRSGAIAAITSPEQEASTENIIQAVLAGIFLGSFDQEIQLHPLRVGCKKPRKKGDNPLEQALRYAHEDHVRAHGCAPTHFRQDIWNRLKRLVQVNKNLRAQELEIKHVALGHVTQVSTDSIQFCDGESFIDRTYKTATNTYTAMKKTSHHNPL